MKKIDGANFPYKQDQVLSAEFELIHALKFNLIVYHCTNYMGVITGTKIHSDKVCRDIVAAANDMYLTDVPLMHPPYIITLAAVLVGAIVHNNLDLRWWFAQFDSDVMKEIWEVSTELLDMYAFDSKEKQQKALDTLKKVRA